MRRQTIKRIILAAAPIVLLNACTVQHNPDMVRIEPVKASSANDYELSAQMQSQLSPYPQNKTRAVTSLNSTTEQRTAELVPPTLSQQFTALRKAAVAGNSMAQAQLANMYLEGNFVQNDIDMALEWYQTSAKNNFTFAQLMLAILYQEGTLVVQDLEQSAKWFASAKKSPLYPVAARLVGDRSSLNKNSIFYNRERANHWYFEAAQRHDYYAQLRLADYYSGHQDKNSQMQALKWYSKAAALAKDGVAQYNLGLIFSEGKGVKVDQAEAFKWFFRSAIQRFGAAQFHVAQMYQDGVGVKQNKVRAYAWYKTAEADLEKAQGLNDENMRALKTLRQQLTTDEVERAVKIGWELRAMFAEQA